MAEVRRMINADEAGVGKTLPTLEAVRRLDGWPLLIAATNASKGSWERETSRLLGWPSFYFDGTPRQRDRLWQRFKSEMPPVTITSYSMIRELLDRLAQQRFKVPWKSFICDEVHMDHVGLLNRTKTFLNVREMALQTPNLFLVTGTPVRRNPADLWTLLHLVAPKTFTSYWDFVNKYCITIKGPFGTDIEERPKDLRQWRALLKLYMIRRRKKDVLPELPRKLRIPQLIEMTKAQRRMYDQLLEGMVAEIDDDNLLVVPNAMSKTLRLRQLMATPQLLGSNDMGGILQVLPELAEQEFSRNKPVVFFTPFTQAIPFITQRLKKTGCAIRVITGGMTGHAIAETSKAFQQCRESKSALICSIKSATSFDAYAASRNYFLGCEWSSGPNRQAEDRLHRSGQLEPVDSCYCLYKDSVIDDRIMEILDDKQRAENWTLNPEEVMRDLKKTFKRQ